MGEPGKDNDSVMLGHSEKWSGPSGHEAGRGPDCKSPAMDLD